MNILINCPSSLKNNNKLDNKLGAIESLTLALAKKLSEKKINVTISSICTNDSKVKKIKNIPISIIKKEANKFSFDAIISSNDASIFNYFPECNNNIFWLHNQLQIEKAIRKKQFSSIIKNKITAVFVSSYLNKITSKLYFFKKRLVINNFLLPQFNIKKPNHKRKSIFVWSVQREKGLDETISMWIKSIFPRTHNAKFYILGINKLNKKYNLKYLNSKNIFFKGRLEKSKIKKIYQESTAMICLGYDETFCLNALEANSCGLPIITFGKTALKDYSISNYNSIIAKNFNDLENKIFYLSSLNKRKKDALIKNSFNHSKKFRLNIISKLWIKLFKVI